MEIDVLKSVKFNLYGFVIFQDASNFLVMDKYNFITKNNVMIKIPFLVMNVTNLVKYRKDIYVLLPYLEILDVD